MSELTLTQATSDFLRYLLIRKNRSPNTIVTYEKILRLFIAYTGDMSTFALSLSDIDQYAYCLFAAGCAIKTQRNRLAVVRSFVRYLYAKDLTTLKPEKIELPYVPQTEATFLTTQEARRFIRSITDVRDRAMFLCMLASWVRVSELLAITLDDIHEKSIIIRQGKGRKARVVFLNTEAIQALQRYLHEKRGTKPGPLFLTRQATPLHARYVNRLVHRYANKASITKNVSCHTLRHTGATGFLEKGGNLEDVQQLLGHKNIHTTMIYLHFTNERLYKNYKSTMPKQMYTSRHKQKSLTLEA